MNKTRECRDHRGKGKKVKKLEEKKGILIPVTVFPFHMLQFLVPQSRENERISDVFLPTLFMHLVHTTASNHQTHPANLPRQKGCVPLSAAKVGLEIRWK